MTWIEKRDRLFVAALLVGAAGLTACAESSDETALGLTAEEAAEEAALVELRSYGFGRYRNAAAAVWDGSERESQYVPADDGTRLAVDVHLPTRGGEPPSGPVPVVLHYTRYIRAVEGADGEVSGQADSDPVLRHLLRHGYAVAVADARGTGASFGVHHGAFSIEETRDSYALIEWLGSRPWSNGRVGMSGRSYPGMTQYQAVTQAPPSLKAIFAEMAGPSAYDFIYRGGAFKKDFLDVWGAATRLQDLGESGAPARVDEDVDGALRTAAIAEHAQNLWARELIVDGSHLRDFSIDREGGGHWSWDRVIATIDDVDEIAASGVGLYHLVGWYDIYTTQQPWLYATLEGRASQKMMIGPWVHSGGYGGTVHKAEILRWYDYWLKEIDNGVLDEDPVHYYVMEGNHTLPAELEADAEVPPTVDEARAEDASTWISTRDWPPATQERTAWLSVGPSGTISSSNDGRLELDAPGAPGKDGYTVDPTSKSGSFSRWMNGYGARRGSPAGSTFFDERSAENRRALTYTSAPLEEPLRIVGYPTAHLRVVSSDRDGDFFVYLEEVDAEGRSHYVSEGVVRASHRKTSDPPFENFGLPFHRSLEEDLEPMVPGRETALSLDLMGTAIVIDAGHRIRITVTGADVRNFALHPDPSGREPPRIEILRGGENGSHVVLPVVAGGR